MRPEQTNNIKKDQILSNFKGVRICSKSGIHNLLKQAKKQFNIEINWFVPCSFDLNQNFDCDNFIEY